VIRFDGPHRGWVTVTFDDGRTDGAKIVEALEQGNFRVQGQPVYPPPGKGR